MTALGRALRDIRAELSLSLHEVSKRSGVSMSTLSKIERGLSDPRWTVVESCARGCGVSTMTLVGRAHQVGGRTVRVFPDIGCQGNCEFSQRGGALRCTGGDACGRRVGPLDPHWLELAEYYR